LQKLLGTINWLRPYLGITTQDLAPLFQALRGIPDLRSERHLTSEGLQALQLVTEALEHQQSRRIVPHLEVALIIIHNKFHPYGLLGQWDPTAKDPLCIL
ncbi:POK19 protein, partial [Chloroceryle aenea]|nr:POK19 protein [Chloroceryle aenea]NXI59604.1 POK19 protein [Chloroceryle aenea]